MEEIELSSQMHSGDAKTVNAMLEEDPTQGGLLTGE